MRQRRARVGTKGPSGQNLHVARCVTDELLAHHRRAALQNMMRSPFLIGTCHTPTCQKQSHKSRQCETADGAKSAPREFWNIIIWRKICRNPQRESLWSQLVIFENLPSLNQLEILRRKSTARISLILPCHFRESPQSQSIILSTYHPLNISSGGNSAAEIHSKNFCLSKCPPRDVVIIWKFCVMWISCAL